MNRRIRKYMSKSGALKVTALLIFGGGLVSFGFQNCSQVSVSDMTLEEKAEAARVARIGAGEETVTVGLNTVPSLKLFFSVDNSGTMLFNQLNLADSFAAMFDANSSDSLSKFDTTIRVTNTAQRSPLLDESFNGQNILNQIANQQSSARNLIASPISDTEFRRLLRTSEKNEGRLPGDNLGFNLTKTDSPLSFEFAPAFVMDAISENGQTRLQEAIRKPAGVSGDQIEQEFRRRIEVLNNQRIPLGPIVNSSVAIEHASIVNDESGLCSIARVLRNPDRFISSGDLAAFTVVSDEDDIGADGRRCIQSIRKITSDVGLVDGKCMKATTALTGQFSTSTPNADNCQISGKTGLTFKFDYPQVVTDIKYRIRTQDEKWSMPRVAIRYGIIDQTTPASCNGVKNTAVQYPVLKSAATFQADSTIINYTETYATYGLKKTDVRFWYERCYNVQSDGGSIQEFCQLNSVVQNRTVDGYQKQNCLNVARTELSKLNDPLARVVDTAANPLSCTERLESVSSCASSNANCVIGSATRPALPVTVAGNHSISSTTCFEAARTLPGFTAGTTPSCVYQPRLNLTTCTGEPTAANCRPLAPAQYEYNVASIDSAPIVTEIISSSNCAARAAVLFATNSKRYALAGEATHPSICQERTQNYAGRVCTTAELERGGTTSPERWTYKLSNAVNVDGKDFTDSQCVTEAAKLSGYRAESISNIKPQCANTTPRELASCSTAQQAIGCTKLQDAAYSDRGGSATAADRDLTTTSTACYDYVRSSSVSNSQKAVTELSHVECIVRRNAAVIRNRTVDITFKTLVESGIDNGLVVPVKDSACGLYQSFAFSRLSNSDGFVRSVDTCTISNILSFSDAPVSMAGRTVTCQQLAEQKCIDNKHRDCRGVSSSSNPTLATTTKSFSANERLACTTLCKDSKTNFCKGLQDTNSNATIQDFIKQDMNNSEATCSSAAPVNVTASAITKNGVVNAQRESACEPEALTGIPYYFVENQPARIYYSESTQVEYVSGVQQDGVTPVPLVEYIKKRSEELAGGQMIFAALVRLPTDPTGQGGSVGAEYLKLINETSGQSGSALSNDYSVALRDLGRVIKDNLIRSMSLRTMRADQIIKRVYRVNSNGDRAEVPVAQWTQNGTTLVFDKSLEINEGDQFLVKYQNNVDEEL